MIMCFKMMRLSSEWLVKKQCVHSRICLPSFCLPIFLASSFFHPLFTPSPNKQERWHTAVQPSPLELSLVVQIPLAPGHEPQCTKLFLSTDIKYWDLWGQNSAIAITMSSAWMREEFCCVFKMSPNEFTECLQVKEHKIYLWPEQVTLSHELYWLWERKVAKYFRTVFQYFISSRRIYKSLNSSPQIF